jgi:hypothetical protein
MDKLQQEGGIHSPSFSIVASILTWLKKTQPRNHLSILNYTIKTTFYQQTFLAA